MIKPTVGSTLLYLPRPDECSHLHGQPFVAFVTHVHKPYDVNLFVISDKGVPFVRLHTPFVTPDYAQPGECCWAPYQIDQAKPLSYPAEPLI